jgi:pyruvate dehydrogenase E2 component (dihydrolipoyllysine-residue acetyltransferase)
VLVLALPGAALAQTPGDDQYTDPFGSGQDSTAQATPTPTPAPAPAPTAPAPAPVATAAPAPAPATAASQQLPRTGGDPITPAVAGFWLLLGGVALRARTRAPANCGI